MNNKSFFLFAVIGLTAFATTIPGLARGSSQSAVSTSGSVITIKGSQEQSSPAVKLAAGAYIVSRTAGDGFISISAKNAAQDMVQAMFLNDPRESYLLVVNDMILKPGDIVFEIGGGPSWTVTVTKAEASDATALPMVLSGGEMKRAISKPFKANAGNLTVTYAYKAKPQGTGTLMICDIATGKPLDTDMMYAGRESGTMTVKVPAAGIFIAETGFPLASSGGEVKIAQ